MTDLTLFVSGRSTLILAGIIGSVPGVARADFTKTIEVTPGVQTTAVATWYYANCNSVLGVGSYSVLTAPAHGSVAFGQVSAPIPGCTNGPALPAAVAYYTWTDASTAMSDHFQLAFLLNGSTASTDDIQVVRQMPTIGPPRIFIGATDITGINYTVVVGQQVPLSVSVDLPPDVSVVSQQWTIPGTLVATYSAFFKPNGETITLVPPEDLMNGAVTFHWIEPGQSRKVTYNATLSNGVSLSAETTFEVLGPTPADPTQPLVTWKLGDVDIVEGLLGGSWMYLGGRILNRGIVLSSNVMPPGGVSGTLIWIQLVDSSVSVGMLPDGVQQPHHVSGLDILDSFNDSSIEDDPGIQLNSQYVKESEEMHASTYLMWKPVLPASVPAPLGFVKWGWIGTATDNSGGGAWTLDDPTAGFTDDFVASTQYPPPWTTVARQPAGCSISGDRSLGGSAWFMGLAASGWWVRARRRRVPRQPQVGA